MESFFTWLSPLNNLRYLSIVVISNQFRRPRYTTDALFMVAKKYLLTIPSLQYLDVDIVCTTLFDLVSDEGLPKSLTFWRKTQVDSRVTAEQMERSDALEIRARMDYDGMEVDPLVVPQVD